MFKISDLRFQYPKSNEEILSGINLEVDSADKKISIVGPNGSGKTHLLYSLLAMIKFQGQIDFSGTELRSMSILERAKKMSWLPQTNHLAFDIKVESLIEFGQFAHNGGRLSRSDRVAVDQVILALGLEEIRHRWVSTLSQGQRQRVYIARTLAAPADIFLLDEPFNHLDIHYSIHILNYLKTLPACVLLIHHHLPLCRAFSDEVWALSKGKVAFRGHHTDFGLPWVQKVFNCSQLEAEQFLHF